jgi:hypothetical protein
VCVLHCSCSPFCRESDLLSRGHFLLDLPGHIDAAAINVRTAVCVGACHMPDTLPVMKVGFKGKEVT